MNKKMILISIGAVVIALMMVSSATATLQHIDSNIEITKKYEKNLTDAYNKVDNADFKILLGKIIDLLKTKKVVTSDDIKEIIEDNNLAVGGVYGGRPINGGGPGTCGPHFIRLYWGMFMYWQARQSDCPGLPISVTVGPDTYTSDHSGLAISFFGLALHSWGYTSWGGYSCSFTIGEFFPAVGFLIFIS